MNIVIVGCGKIGTSIISRLVAEGHDIVAVDANPAVISEISNVFDVMCVCGNGADCSALEEADAGKAELFVAATDSDETNMLSCFLAGKMGARHTIARIRNPEYNDKSLTFIRQQLGLTVSVNPEWMAAQEIFNMLKLPAAANIESFSGGNIEMVELKLKSDTPLDGMKLSDLRKKYKAKFLVCAVQRGEEVHIPDGNFVLNAGDKIGLTAAPTEIQKLLKMLGISQKQARNVMILGGSKIAYYLAKRLVSSGNNVKIIEKDEKRASELASLLPEAVIIQGDGADQELLLEEGIDTTDAFVALTGMDEENILISIFASTHKVPKIISKVNRDGLADMAVNLGIECIISPKKIVSDVLAKYARALENSLGSDIETLYKLMDGSIEALEFSVGSDFKGVKTPLKELSLKPGILIAGIIRARRAMLPSGDDMIMPNDRVVVIVSGQKLSDLSDIIR